MNKSGLKSLTFGNLLTGWIVELNLPEGSNDKDLRNQF